MNSDTSRGSPTGSSIERRTFLKGAAGLAGAAVAGAGASAPAAAQSAFGGWFDGVSNYDGVVDLTGESEVTVEVGASGNDGNFAFGPAAVRVDPGTTVVWEWTGQGGSHDVVAEGGSFESGTSGESGHTFEHTFEETGAFRYACTPHKAMGMKGAVMVGDEAASSAPSVAPQAPGGRSLGDLLTLGFAGVLVAGLLGLPVAENRSKDR